MNHENTLYHPLNWETGHLKITEKETFHFYLYAALLPFFPIEQASKILPVTTERKN